MVNKLLQCHDCCYDVKGAHKGRFTFAFRFKSIKQVNIDQNESKKNLVINETFVVNLELIILNEFKTL